MLGPFLLLLGLPILHAHPTVDTNLAKRSFYGDPRRNITCLGSKYDLQLPPGVNETDPNELTMQQLCAKTVYGGAPAGRHLGGWCSRGLKTRDLRHPDDSDDADDPDDSEDSDVTTNPYSDTNGVSFDLSDASHADEGLADPRFLLGCFNRCFCNYGVTDLTMQPKREEPSAADTYSGSESRNTGEIRLDVDDNLLTRGRSHDGRLGDVVVDTVEMEEVVEPNEENGFGITDENADPSWILSLDAGNYITCEGDLPSFPLPQPYPVSEFESAQELCAVQWSGGRSGANAGGYCHRSNPHGAFGDYGYENYVWFSDEMTPRYEYTWGGGNFFLSASLRTYCYAHCYCNSVGKQKTSRSKFVVWQMLRNHELVSHSDGSMDYGKRGPLSKGLYEKIADVLPPQDPSSGAGGGTAGTCGPDGKQFCPAPWPKELGEIPRAPPFSTQILPPVGPPAVGQKKDMTVCGSRCESNRDCSPSLDFYACDCAFPTSEDAQILGLDPVAPPSICLSLNRVRFGLIGSLSGRDLEGSEMDLDKAPRYVDEAGNAYQCRCNSTYIGNECCGVSDGMVWLN